MSGYEQELAELDEEHRAFAVKRNRWPLLLDCDHIYCQIHGDVGHNQQHGWESPTRSVQTGRDGR